MTRAFITLAALLAILTLASAAPARPIGTLATASSRHTGASTDVAPDLVIQWNQILLGILRTPGAQPATVHPTRSLAITHVAIYDAVNAIDRSHAAYLVKFEAPPDASREAAVAAAAHGTLIELFPQLKAMLDERLSESLAPIPDGPGKREGIHAGERAAELILALRSNDGSVAPPPAYTPGTSPGDYQLTPPNFPQPVFTHWAHVTPFVLKSADQFRPAPPPALTSSEYTAAFQEVKPLGAVGSASRSPDQTQIGKFWAAPIQNYWNEIAQTASLAHGSTLTENARLFALLNLTFADAVIAFYDGKYAYSFWRPVTAIRAADTDGNPATVADPSWTPLAVTAPDPSYPGAHSVMSAAGATILRSFFGNDNLVFSIRSEVLPGVQRSFDSFTAASEEAGLSRIYAGQHFRFDHSSGQELGRNIASYVSGRALEASRAGCDGRRRTPRRPSECGPNGLPVAAYYSNEIVPYPRLR